MNNERHSEQLFADVLSEGAVGDFREALLSRTVQESRKRLRNRQILRTAVVLTALIPALLWYQRHLPPHSGEAVAARTEPAFELVETQLLPAAALVTTQPFARQMAFVALEPVAMVQTTPTSGGFGVINDNELLELVAARPAILVRDSSTSERLVFVDPPDEKGFPLN